MKIRPLPLPSPPTEPALPNWPTQCPACHLQHHINEHEWVFTFGPVATHPDTGESLRWAYVVIRGTAAAAAAQAIRMFGNTWQARFRDREEAGVERYGLTEVAWPKRQTGEAAGAS